MRNTIALLAVFTACACSTVMNWRFSVQLGATTFDGYTWGAFSVALDVAKWFMLPLAAATWKAQKMRAMAAALIWICATVYSFSAALGFAALNRDTVTAERRHHVDQSETLATMRQSPRWRSSSACADVTTNRSRDFCRRYRELEALIVAAPTDPDPQSALLARMTGLTTERARLALSIFLAISCEVISALGMFAILGPEATRALGKIGAQTTSLQSAATVLEPAPAGQAPAGPAIARQGTTWKRPQPWAGGEPR